MSVIEQNNNRHPRHGRIRIKKLCTAFFLHALFTHSSKLYTVYSRNVCDIIIGPTGESFLWRLCGVVFFLLVEPLKLHFVGL